jgi:hypothetical protein
MSGGLRRRLPFLYGTLRQVARLGREESLDPTWERIARGLSPGGLAVQAGPFAGMRYLAFAGGSGLLPKIAGSYELELHAAVSESIARSPVRLINIGSAEGYYAVGYALRLPEIEVHAFDTDVMARQRLGRLARHNGVLRRIRRRTLCTHEQLERLIVPRTLIVCDCEGCEGELLDPRRAPRLGGADLLVELHVEQGAEIAAAMLERFAATHAWERIEMASREPASRGPQLEALLSRLAPEDRSMALYERNERTEWLWLRSKLWPAAAASRANLAQAGSRAPAASAE